MNPTELLRTSGMVQPEHMEQAPGRGPQRLRSASWGHQGYVATIATLTIIAIASQH